MLPTLSHRDRFRAALAGKPVDRPPVWLMRQAGRYLPEYRELKSRHGFLTLVRTPELATQVSLQPLARYALDAAIVFSDILVIPEALGQPYRFLDQGGIALDFPCADAAAIERLDPSAVPAKLAYVGDALRLLRSELGASRALIGFAGAPWTLAAYMVEGGSSDDFPRLRALAAEAPGTFAQLMETLCLGLEQYLDLQVAAGVDAIQLFDSWAGLCPGDRFDEWCLQWSRRLVNHLAGRVPVILFARGAGAHLPSLAASGAAVLGLDTSHDLAASFRSLPPSVGIQGNLDPVFLNLEPGLAAAATRRLLERTRGRAGYIFNLGHGIQPQARPESVAAVIDTVTAFA